ncbi:hypothetical protein SADUNF_Sadunf16G0216500 [Salix dunnii]|uniref:Uncharacterized protein n=1 Tax=Salix dunnii TaxID=1413687 RepID=A0A835JAZ0_9ROSI|nr:hypothetical protein SADUNF_Sadunf16G0216500 [Salix dunnii]
MFVFESQRKGFFGSSLALASTLGKQESGDEFHRGSESEGEVGKEQDRKIDVLALARSLLHFAKTVDDIEECELPVQVFASMIRCTGWDRKMEPTLALVNNLEMLRLKGFSPGAASHYSALLTYREMEGGNGALKFFVELTGQCLKGKTGKDAETKIGKRNMQADSERLEWACTREEHYVVAKELYISN